MVKRGGGGGGGFDRGTGSQNEKPLANTSKKLMWQCPKLKFSIAHMLLLI